MHQTGSFELPTVAHPAETLVNLAMLIISREGDCFKLGFFSSFVVEKGGVNFVGLCVILYSVSVCMRFAD